MPTDYYDNFNDRAYFKEATTWWPKRCHNTGRWIIGRHIMGVRMITGPGDTIIETRWYHRNNGILMLLKRNSHGTI